MLELLNLSADYIFHMLREAIQIPRARVEEKMNSCMKMNEIQRIAIVGAGLMGSQIGMEFALAGYEVCLHDVTEEKLQQLAS